MGGGGGEETALGRFLPLPKSQTEGLSSCFLLPYIPLSAQLYLFLFPLLHLSGAGIKGVCLQRTKIKGRRSHVLGSEV